MKLIYIKLTFNLLELRIKKFVSIDTKSIYDNVIML